jgi:hypothetical protein
VYDIIAAAGGIFFTGGDQWKYVSWWNDTLVSTGMACLASDPIDIAVHDSDCVRCAIAVWHVQPLPISFEPIDCARTAIRWIQVFDGVNGQPRMHE